MPSQYWGAMAVRAFAALCTILCAGCVSGSGAHPAKRVSGLGSIAQSKARASDAPWWKSAVVYQVYPRSFQDSDSDGVGDLRGLSSRLDYLADLGVQAIWISPMFQSPMRDFGYDISDYRAVDPIFGDLPAFDALVQAAHARGLKIILDFVPNHTSDLHPWFKASRSSLRDPKRDWYVWKDPAEGGGPPNNWLSWFGGSAWTLDKASGQYYYHAYLREQPDLNWRHPEVQRELAGVMRFWLARGVDGFRVDAILALMEDARLRDNPANPAWKPSEPEHAKVLKEHTRNVNENHEMVRFLRRVSDEFPGRVFIGETYLPVEELGAYYGTKGDEFHLPFNFHLAFVPWKGEAIKSLIRRYEAALPPGAWPNWVTGNHDRPRIATRLGAAQAKVAAALLLSLRGTPTLYYGEELGMTDVPIPPSLVQDPFEKNDPGKGNGRDPERTPMQWDRGVNAGFTRGPPWLPLARDARSNNVATQTADPRSMLSFYKELLRLRRTHPALALGSVELLPSPSDVILFERKFGGERMLVALNLSHVPQLLSLRAGAGEVSLSTDAARRGSVSGTVVLAPDEALLLKLQ